ncbi:MAG: hypothetical protein C0613_07195 [Desulfobulbaceae bacterium]|nr:MAG: hypothetical protein C0613_07195 [Desulfobulbaceae bacterium]
MGQQRPFFVEAAVVKMPPFAMQKSKVLKQVSFLVEAAWQGTVEKLLARARLHIEDVMLVYFVFLKGAHSGR